MRSAALIAMVMASACTCFTPVEECGRDCAVDAGSTGGGSAGDGGSTVRDAGCAIWDGGGVGTCAALTGYVFDGNTCQGACVTRPITAPGVFEDYEACIGRCAGAGFCDESKWRGFPGPPPPPLEPDTYCDDVILRVPPGHSIEPVREALGGLESCSVGPEGTDCMLWHHLLREDGVRRVCAATLVQTVEWVTCMIYL